MRQRIICGIDASERTYEAVAVAWDLARRLELPLMLAHVVDEPAGFPFGEPDAMQRERRQCEARGMAVLRDLATTFDLPPETELRAESGDPAAMLRTLADEEDAAMLVVASRGRGRIRAALFGSVTAELVDGLRCPLMVVGPGAATAYRTAATAQEATVVCGIDGSTQVEHLMPVADRVAAALHARLLILHADLPPVAAASGASERIGIGLAGSPAVLHEPAGRDRNGGQDQLERARDLVTETTRVDTRAELGDLAATIGDLAERPWVRLLAIAQDSPWQRVAARAGCAVLVVPHQPVPHLRDEEATAAA